MRYLLDTNTCVDYLNGRWPSVVARIQRSDPGDLRLSSVAVAELRYGADKSARLRENHARIDQLVQDIQCLDFDLGGAAAYGRIRADLEVIGKTIGPNDLLIAAKALSQGLVLITNNLREFQRVKGLQIENWRG
ncbi:MAG TPA: type II toxin-antitoxin system VapC family toxin [Thermoanaerobaculia bacterium]